MAWLRTIATRRLLGAAIAASAFVASADASAQGPVSLDLRGFHAPTDPASALYLEPAASPGTGEYNAALWFNYVYRPIVLRDAATGEVAFRVITHQLTSDLTFNVGFFSRFALGFDLPVLIYQTGDAPNAASKATLGDTPLSQSSLGDLGLDGKLTLVRPTGGDFGGFALALAERFTLPTGEEASYLGEGAVTSETRLLAEYRLVALTLHVAAGVKFRAEKERFACAAVPEGADCPSSFGHELPFGFGIALRPQVFGLDDKGRWTWFLETHGYLPLSPVSPFSSKLPAEAQLGLSARYAITRNLSVLGGVETALAGGVGNAPLRATLTIDWAPRFHDSDHDGVEDDKDQCRELPEDRDGFQDADGCPEGDNDDDGVPDADDRCPNQKEDEDGYQDDDGCPDPDNDGDKIPDVRDACPNQAGPANPDPKLNGCPPSAAGSGAPAALPAPQTDSDGDGVPDAEDACPKVAGDNTPGNPKRGCPVEDPDKDTFVGAEDKCPDKPEVFNGVDDDDGCPDESKGPLLAAVHQRKDGPVLVLGAPVKFTASNEVDPTTAVPLRAVAAELLKHPEWTVAVGVRPSAKGGENEALLRAFAAVDALRRFTHRDQGIETVAWTAVKGLPSAETFGVGFLVLTGGGGDAKPPPAPKPADAKPEP